MSDHGSNFIYEFITQQCTILKKNTIRSFIYHAEGDGLVERFNGAMKGMLRNL